MTEAAAAPAAEAAAPEAAAAPVAPTGIAALLGVEPAAAAGPTDAEALRDFLRDGQPDPDAPPAANAFLDSFKDPDLKTFVEKKGFKDTEGLAKSYAELLRLASGDAAGRILPPKDETDTEGYDRVFKALGRPDTPDGYEFSQLQGVDADFAKEAAAWLHEGGMSKGRAGKLAERWNAYVSNRATADAARQDKAATAELAGLRTEWGPQYEAELENAKRGARTFGLSGDDMEALGGALGVSRAMKLLNSIGKGLGEDTFVDGGGKAGFGVTVDQAKARMDALGRDSAWQSRWMNGGAAEKEEWSRLNGIVSKATAQ